MATIIQWGETKADVARVSKAMADPPVIVKNSAQALAEVLRAVDAWQGMRGDSDAADTLAEVHDVLVRRGYATPCFGLSPKGQTAKAP